MQAVSGAKGRCQVTTGGGNEPLWRRDGAELFYIADDTALPAVSVGGSATAFVSGTPRPLFKTNMRRDPVYARRYAVTNNGERFLLSRPVDESPWPIAVILNWTTGLPKN